MTVCAQSFSWFDTHYVAHTGKWFAVLGSLFCWAALSQAADSLNADCFSLVSILHSEGLEVGFFKTGPLQTFNTEGLTTCSTVKTNPCFRYKGKTREERNLVIFKGTYEQLYQSKALDETFSLICLLIGLSSKITKLRSPPVSPPYLKQE